MELESKTAEAIINEYFKSSVATIAEYRSFNSLLTRDLYPDINNRKELLKWRNLIRLADEKLIAHIIEKRPNDSLQYLTELKLDQNEQLKDGLSYQFDQLLNCDVEQILRQDDPNRIRQLISQSKLKDKLNMKLKQILHAQPYTNNGHLLIAMVLEISDENLIKYLKTIPRQNQSFLDNLCQFKFLVVDYRKEAVRLPSLEFINQIKSNQHWLYRLIKPLIQWFYTSNLDKMEQACLEHMVQRHAPMRRPLASSQICHREGAKFITQKDSRLFVHNKQQTPSSTKNTCPTCPV